jgi:Protein of unknown function (DUF4235)
MSGKRADGGNRMLTGLAGFAAAFAARKLIYFAWKRITGKEPPEHPEDPQVALGEALAWGVVMGAGVYIARMLATRATSKRIGGPTEPAE